ncbi:MAG: hypothetical protein AMXMBFR82_37560 [Candidatus Hydrogenedentota bacterium]
MARRVAVAAVLTLWGLATAQPPPSVGGTLRVEGTGEPIRFAYVALLTSTFDVAGQASSDANGRYSIELAQPVSDGYLVFQPPPQENAQGLGIYAVQPRLIRYTGEKNLDLQLPSVGCIVLNAYNGKGELMRWKDFRAQGTFGDQFMYLTTLDDQALPAVSWPVFDEEARAQGQPRDLGIPALVVKPGSGYVPQVLFWDVSDYGRFLLRADNGGAGFAIAEAGDACVLELNVELARTAVHQLAESGSPDAEQLRSQLKDAESAGSAAERAAAADAILADALRFRDTYLVESARESIPSVRMGEATIRVTDAQGKPVAGTAVTIEQQSSDFLFGVFEGSPYNSKAFAKAREAGFNLATVLLGWGWTDGAPRDAIEQTFGVAALGKLGYAVKAHGVVWLQNYGILPDRARSLSHADLTGAMLAHESSLIETLGGDIAVWEAMNEPNVTNVVGLPRPMVHELLGKSSGRIAGAGLALVNGAHEGDYGRKYALFDSDGTPANDWNVTYSTFLEEAAFVGGTKQVDIIGLQYYPGFHFNESFGGLQGPATTPSWFYDLIERYAAFERTVHVTEFSLPSTYESSWTSGYWREPWTETTQADYAEMIFTLAFAHPAVQSISWWDILDTKSSVISGGLLRADGSPKPAFDRLSSLLSEWTRHHATGETNGDGQVTLSGYGGDYLVRIDGADGVAHESSVHIRERESVSVDVALGVQP